MWFWLALIAILFWSGSDLFSKMGARPEDKYSHLKQVMAVGGIMGLHAISLIIGGAEFELYDMVRYLPASFFYILSMVLGYIGLRYVKLSISSPVCNSSGAVSAILMFLLLGETMTSMQLIAVVFICLGVFGLSVIESRGEDRVRGFIPLVFPLLYCLIDALGTYADALLLDTVIAEGPANIAYELTFLSMGILAFIYLTVIKKEKIIIKKERPKLIAGVCETAGQFAYIYAIGANPILAAPMISSYCLASLVWSHIFLKERLTKQQYVVLAVAAVGIIMLGIFGE